MKGRTVAGHYQKFCLMFCYRENLLGPLCRSNNLSHKLQYLCSCQIFYHHACHSQTLSPASSSDPSFNVRQPQESVLSSLVVSHCPLGLFMTLPHFTFKLMTPKFIPRSQSPFLHSQQILLILKRNSLMRYQEAHITSPNFQPLTYPWWACPIESTSSVPLASISVPISPIMTGFTISSVALLQATLHTSKDCNLYKQKSHHLTFLLLTLPWFT